jgi:hypothetical protein
MALEIRSGELTGDGGGRRTLFTRRTDVGGSDGGLEASSDGFFVSPALSAEFGKNTFNSQSRIPGAFTNVNPPCDDDEAQHREFYLFLLLLGCFCGILNLPVSHAGLEHGING